MNHPPAVIVYLEFAGRCEEAISFYKQALNAEIDAVLRFNESPDPVPEGMLQEGFENKIMHCSFRVGNTVIMASDGCNDQTSSGGFRLNLTVATEEEADRYFNGLADGGRIDMPLMKTFWSPKYGMLTDKFGIGWMVMVTDPSWQSNCNQ